MTVAGAAWKSFALVLLAAASAGYTWYQILQVPDRDITGAIFGGAIAALTARYTLVVEKDVPPA